MILNIKTNGTITMPFPERIYQGSLGVNTVELIGAFPTTSEAIVSFKLPDGTLVPQQAMDKAVFDDINMLYTYTLEQSVTEQAGFVEMSFVILNSNQIITTAIQSFEVEATVQSPIYAPGVQASDVIFDPATSTLISINVQNAIDEADAKAEIHNNGTGEDHTFIDQDVTIGANPKFNSIKFNIRPGDLEEIPGEVYYDETHKTLTIIGELGNKLQVGSELGDIGVNKTGVSVGDGKAVAFSTPQGHRPTFQFADASVKDLAGLVGVTTTSSLNNEEAWITTFGIVHNLDTTAWTAGTKLYLSDDGSGDLVSIPPTAPSFIIWMATVLEDHITQGTIFVSPRLDYNNGITFNSLNINEGLTIGGKTLAEVSVPRDFVNGTFIETFDAIVDITNGQLNVEQTGGGNLTMQLSTGNFIFDTLTKGNIQLTYGTATSPQGNFIYIPISTKVLTKDLNTWPAEEHIRVTYVSLLDNAFTATEGSLINQNWNDHLKSVNGMGHETHITSWIRRQGARWDSNLDGAGNNGYVDIVGEDAFLKTNVGIVSQLHLHTFTAKDTNPSTGEDNFHVLNDFTTPYKPENNLANLIVDANGASLTGRYFNIIFWAAANKTGTHDPLFINLPTGSYAALGDALIDADAYDSFLMPDSFTKDSGTGFLIARITIRRQANGIFTVHDTHDLRRSTPGSILSSGGIGIVTTEFSTTQFRMYEPADSTKRIGFDASLIPTLTTKTITMPNADINLGDILLNTEAINEKTSRDVAEEITGHWVFNDSLKLPRINENADSASRWVSFYVNRDGSEGFKNLYAEGHLTNSVQYIPLMWGGERVWTDSTFDTQDIINWNEAYGWGGHSGLYLGLNSTADNSDKLDEYHASDFIIGTAGELAQNMNNNINFNSGANIYGAIAMRDAASIHWWNAGGTTTKELRYAITENLQFDGNKIHDDGNFLSAVDYIKPGTLENNDIITWNNTTKLAEGYTFSELKLPRTDVAEVITAEYSFQDGLKLPRINEDIDSASRWISFYVNRDGSEGFKNLYALGHLTNSVQSIPLYWGSNQVWTDAYFQTQDLLNWDEAFGWGDHADTYITLGSKVDDSDKLDGYHSSDFLIGKTGELAQNMDNNINFNSGANIYGAIAMRTAAIINWWNAADEDVKALRFGPVTGKLEFDSKPLATEDLIPDNTDYVDLLTAQTIVGAKTFSDDMVVNGNLYVNGTKFISNTEQIDLADNLILINSDHTGTPTQDGGLEVERGTETNFQFLFVEATDDFRIGEVGGLQPVATRDEVANLTTGDIMTWDAATYQLKGFTPSELDLLVSTTDETITGTWTFDQEINLSRSLPANDDSPSKWIDFHVNRAGVDSIGRLYAQGHATNPVQYIPLIWEGSEVWTHAKFNSQDILNWNLAYGWGDHANLYYELGDPVGDATTLDGLDSTQFLRSDATDSASGFITFEAGITLEGAIAIKESGALAGADSNVINWWARDASALQITKALRFEGTSGELEFDGNMIYTTGNFTDNSSDWDAAYGWGNHADGGYQASGNYWINSGTWRGIHTDKTRIFGISSGSGEFWIGHVGTQLHAITDGFFYQNEGQYRVIDENDSRLVIGDGGLTQKNFTTTLKDKLDLIEAGATQVTNNLQITNGAGYITSQDISGKADLSGAVFTGSISTNDNLTIGVYSTTDTGIIYLTGSTANKQGTLKVTNGNMHLDAASGSYAMYLNYYTGTGGVVFGNGAGGSNASVSAGGVFTASGGNSGEWNLGYDHSLVAHAPSDANLITNNLQITNGAGYITGYTETSHSDVVVDGDVSDTNTASKIVKRDSSGDIDCRLLRMEYTTTNASPNYFLTQVAVGTGDNYSRPSTLAQVKTALAITLADVGFTGDSDANLVTNNSQITNGAGYVTSSGNTIIGTDSDINTSGSTIIDNIYVTDGVITSMGTRVLTLANLGFTGDSDANLVTNNSQITNGAGYVTSSHTHTYLPLTGGTLTGTLTTRAVKPSVSDVYNCGESGNRWANVYTHYLRLGSSTSDTGAYIYGPNSYRADIYFTGQSSSTSSSSRYLRIKAYSPGTSTSRYVYFGYSATYDGIYTLQPSYISSLVHGSDRNIKTDIRTIVNSNDDLNLDTSIYNYSREDIFGMIKNLKAYNYVMRNDKEETIDSTPSRMKLGLMAQDVKADMNERLFYTLFDEHVIPVPQEDDARAEDLANREALGIVYDKNDKGEDISYGIDNYAFTTAVAIALQEEIERRETAETKLNNLTELLLSKGLISEDDVNNL